jgi:hypothetical protein
MLGPENRALNQSKIPAWALCPNIKENAKTIIKMVAL